MRSVLAAAGARTRDIAGAVEEHMLWRVADLLRSGADFVKWPFERLAWILERRLIWPLRERAAGRPLPGRAIGAGALAAAAIGVVALGAALTSGGSDEPEPVSTGAPVAAAAPAPTANHSSESTLQGAPPRFGVDSGVGVASAEDDETNDGGAATATAEATPSDEEAGATTSSQKPVPAGPAAMKVARRFSEAFVSYEVGQQPARAASVFEQTATPRLATALAERPPRQPQGSEVPKARVLNLVPGPRRGKVYTVSASLLRVGVTSELRLEMAQRAGAWRVTDVRG